MFGVLFYDILFFSIPVVLVVFFLISIYRYIVAKKNSEKFSLNEIKNRKIILIISSLLVGVILAIVIGFIALMFLAVAFM